MIEFLSLFLGLVAGPQTVQLITDPAVAAVELRLDDERIALLEEPPWKLTVDFGQDLAARRLSAVALDEEGEEIGRAVQMINRPRPPAEATVVLERDETGAARAALVSWQSLVARRPLRTRATFDGEPLEVSDPKRIPLPAHDPKDFHLLHVELEFPGEVTAQVQASFGGEHLDRIDLQLTALPVRLSGRGREPSRLDLEGRLALGETRLSVVAVEKGQAELVIVRGAGVDAVMDELEGLPVEGIGALGTGTAGVSGLSDLRPPAVASQGERAQRAVALDSSTSLRLLLPQATKVEHPYLALELFAASPELRGEDGGLYWALRQRISMPGLNERQRVTDAVAVAALRAATGNRRRAVVVALSPGSTDDSQYRPDQVKSLARSLRVPIHVWCVGEGPCELPGWAATESIVRLADLRKVVRDLQSDLDRQRIVWVGGDLLPEEVTLSADSGVEWLGR